MKKKTLFLLLTFLLFGFITITAQVNEDSSEVDLSINSHLSEYVAPSIFSVSGDAGAYGELYSTSRDVKRRPGATGRLFLRPTFTFLNNFSISFDLFVSTEGSDARQQINRFALHPSWSWGRAHIGDFSHKFSDYSLNGVSIRGGGVEINPGWFRFELLAGQTKRAVVGGYYSSVYSQYLAGAKIGVGKKGGSFFDLNVVLAKDDSNSVPKSTFIIDTNAIGGNPQVGITPQENLLIGFNTDLKIIKNILRLRGEATASLFTRDTYAEKADVNGVPTFLTNIFPLRYSSNADFAYKGILDFRYGFFNTSLKYQVVNPGFYSLGMTSVINDKRKYGVRMGFRLFNNSLMLNLRYDGQNDNLLNQKRYTLSRKTMGANITIRPIRSLAIMFNGLLNNMGNDTSNDTLKIDSKVSSFGTNVSYQFRAFSTRNALTVGYSYQLSENYNFYLRNKGNGKVTVNNIFANLNTTLNSTWSFAPGFTAIMVDSWLGTSNKTYTFSFRINGRFMRSRWNNSLTMSLANSDYTNVTQVNFQSNFRLTKSDMIRVKIRYALTDYIKGPLENFWENIASLNYVHRL